MKMELVGCIYIPMHPIGSRNQGGIQEESPQCSSNQHLHMQQMLAIHNQQPPLFQEKQKQKQFVSEECSGQKRKR